MNNQSRSYPDLGIFETGLKGRCPRCGEGQLLSGLSVRDRCESCGLEFDFADSGDGPAVFIMLILSFVVLGAALYVELNYSPPIWVHVITWPVVLLILGLPMLRIAKGVFLAAQYKLNAQSAAKIDRGDKADEADR